MIDKPPRKPCFITLVIVGILSFIEIGRAHV